MGTVSSVFNEKRMLSEKEATAYIGLGTTRAREWLKKIGARRNFGRHVVYDKVVIDRVLDEMAKEVTPCT